MEQEAITVSTLDVYIRIVSFVVPLLVALFTYLVVNQFGLKERVKVVEIELTHNTAKDSESKENFTKLSDSITEIKNSLHDLQSQVSVLTERLPSKR